MSPKNLHEEIFLLRDMLDKLSVETTALRSTEVMDNLREVLESTRKAHSHLEKALANLKSR